MYNFFITNQNLNGQMVKINGADFNHIKNVLRMKVGDKFLVSLDSKSSLCEIASFENDFLLAQIIEKDCYDTALPIEIYLFQGLPKSDKLELIIQKAVELGAKEIIPVQMERSIAKIEGNKIKSKTERFNAIAESAAKQSKMAFIPMVKEPMSFDNAIDFAKTLDVLLIPYENQEGIKSTISALQKIKKGDKVGIFIGPEGGFSQKEVELAEKNGYLISLGKRILRTETASITAMSMLMLYAEMNLN